MNFQVHHTASKRHFFFVVSVWIHSSDLHAATLFCGDCGHWSPS